MAYAEVADVRNLTGWTEAQIDNTVIGSLIIFSDARVNTVGATGTATELKLLSSLYAAHLGENRLRGNIVSFSDEGTSFRYAEETRWLKEFNKMSERVNSIKFRKVWMRR